MAKATPVAPGEQEGVDVKPEVPVKPNVKPKSEPVVTEFGDMKITNF